MKKLSLLFIALLTGINLTNAGTITVNAAQTVAQNYYNRHAVIQVQNPPLVYTEKTSGGDTAIYFIFNINLNDGFVIVSADDAALPIIGYSKTGHYDTTNISPEFAFHMNKYKQQILSIKANNLQATTDIQNKWQLWGNIPAHNSLMTTIVVNPLTSTTWDQSPNYNALCPGGSVTGCVATTMAQIMKFWNYPCVGTGSHSYCDCTSGGYSQDYGTLSANFAHTYNWSAMPNSVTSANNDVATLMSDCGISVNMDYSPSGSGAYVIGLDNNTAEYAFINYFGYNSNTINGIYKTNYTDSAWIATLKIELNNSRPIQYAGFGSSGGHTWVCDGYDSDNLFHMNWGWGGYDNGYFALNALNPAGTGYDFNSGDEALIGIQPAPAPNLCAPANFTADKTVSYPNGTIQFTDASFGATSWSWNFGDGSAVSTLHNPTHSYTTSGSFNVTLTTNGGSLTKTAYILVLPYKNAPYLPSNGGNFETNVTDFGSMSITGTNFWQRGVPTNGLTTCNSPTHAWGTGLTTNLTQTSATCVLMSPDFNMVTPGTYTLKFRKSMSIVNCSSPFALQLQYSTDRGGTWQRLGAYNDGLGTNWYNVNPAGTCPIGTNVISDQQGWIGNFSNENTQYNISSLAGNTHVAFRIALYVNSSYNAAEYVSPGFLVDDFEVDGPPQETIPATPGAITGNSPICAGSVNTYSIAAVTGADTYTWTLPSGWIGTSIGTSISATAGTAGGNITVTANNSAGSSSAQTFAVTVNALPIATITPNGATTFCQGGSVTLTASTGSSYLWSNGATTQAITANASNAYTVTVFNGNGCSATSSTVLVTVNTSSSPTITANGATTFCSGSSVTLTSSTASTYLWSNNATTQAITVTTGGSYTVVTNSGTSCSATSTPTVVTVNSSPATPSITTGGPTTFCSGGSVTLTSSSATGNTWSPGGATTQAIAATTSGSYTVSVTNGNGCSATSAPVVVTANPLPTATITANGNTTFCQGNSLTLTSSSGTSYLWSNNATTQSITSNASGSYTVRVTDGNGCSATSSATTVTVNPLPATPSITASGATTFCQGGSVTLTSSSSTSNLWSPGGATTQSISAATSGSYTVSVTNGSGCSASSTATIVTVIPTTTQHAYITNFGGTTVSVIDLTTNTVSNTIMVGLHPYGVSVTPDGSKAYIANYGENTVSVINTTIDTVIATIAVGSGPTGVCVSPDGSKVYVTNGTNSANSISVINTTTNTVSTTINVGNSVYGVVLSPDGSKLYVTSGYGNTVSVINTQTNTVIATVTVDTNPYGIVVSPDGSKVFVAHYNANTVSVINTATNTVSATITMVSTQNYGVTFSPDGSKVYVSNGGNNSVSVINAATNIVSTIIPVGYFPVGVSVSQDGSKLYVANANSNTVNEINTTTNTVIATVAVGTTPEAFGNFISNSVFGPDLPTINATNTTICSGNSATLSVVSGNLNNATNWQWYSGSCGGTSVGSGTSINVSPTTTTTYYARGEGGCLTPGNCSSITITVNPTTAIITPNGSTTFCQGNSVTLTANPGASYSWSNNATTQSITVNTSGSYTVSVSYGSGCTASAISLPTTVTVNPLPATPTITAGGSTSFCQGGSVTLTSSSSTGNLWNPGGAITQAISATTSGSYTVSVTNGNGCSATSTPTVVTVTPITTTQHAYITDYGGNTVSVIDLTTNTVSSTITVGTHPYGVSVTPDGSKAYITNYSSNTVSVINTATYTVSATIGVGASPTGVCVSPDGSKVYVTNGNSTAKSISVINTATNTVSATISVGYTVYGIVVSPDGSKLYVSSGYGNTVSIINALTNTVITTLTVNTNPYGITVSPDGSKVYVAHYNSNTVSVINTATNTITATITMVSTQNYGITYSPDGSKVYVSNGGNNSVSVINAATNIVSTVIAVGSFPVGVSITPDGSKLYVANANSNSVSEINTATNTVIATVAVGNTPEAFGNFISSSSSSPDVPTINATNSTICSGNSATLTIASGNLNNATNWQWYSGSCGGTSVGSGTSITVTPTATTTYYARGEGQCVTNGNCGSTTITVNPAQTATITATGSTTFCQGNSVTLTASAGTTYLWSNAATTQSITATTSGNYSVTVTNSGGCFAIAAPTVVTVNPSPTATITASGPITFCQGNSVTLTSTTATSYLWSPGGATTQAITANASGSYTVNVTNGNGCSATSAATVVTVNPLPSTPTITAGGSTNLCTGGSVTLTSSVLTGGTYLWSPGNATTQAITANASGSYTVRVTNSNGCSATSAATVVTVNALPSTPTITAGGTTSFCAGGSVSLTSSAISGGTYLWSPGSATTQAITATASGSYTVRVTNANGCSATSTATVVTVITTPAPTVGSNSPVNTYGTINLTASNITGATYSWTGPNGFTSTAQNPSIINATSNMTGTYTVIATANGCQSSPATVQVTVNGTPPTLTLYIDTVADIQGAQVVVNVIANGFTNLISAQGTIQFDATKISFVQVEQFGLPGMSSANFSTASNTVTFSWNDATLLGVTVPNGSVLFGIRYTITGIIGQFSDLNFVNSPTPPEFNDVTFTIVNATLLPGRVNIIAPVTVAVSGAIISESNAAVRTVTLNTRGSGVSQSMTTATDGLYSFTFPFQESDTIRPSKNNDVTNTNGISTLDILLIQRHILNSVLLSSPYKIIAADVNLSGSVTTLDILLIRAMILGNISTFPNGRMWNFVPSDFVFANPANPFPFNNYKYYPSVIAQSNQNFIGMKLGDVNNSWDPSVAKTDYVGAVNIDMPSGNVLPEEQIKLPVTARQFKSMSGYQFTINWNPTVLSFVGVENAAAVNGEYGLQKQAEGAISVLWTADNATSLDLADETTLFYLTFKAIGKTGDVSAVSISSSVTPVEAVNNNLDLVELRSNAGTVSIGSPSVSDYRLDQNIPNPFNGSTSIRFALPERKEVQIRIFNVLGVEVAAYKGIYGSGEHEMLIGTKESFVPGSYYLQMKAGEFSKVIKMVRY